MDMQTVLRQFFSSLSMGRDFPILSKSPDVKERVVEINCPAGTFWVKQVAIESHYYNSITLGLFSREDQWGDRCLLHAFATFSHRRHQAGDEGTFKQGSERQFGEMSEFEHGAFLWLQAQFQQFVQKIEQETE